MDPRPTPPPPPGESGVPAVRPPNPVARPDDVRPADGPPSGPPPTPETPAHRWRRLTRTRKGAAGVAILAAALLLWPFAGWFWIPWLAGLVVLVLVALLRLDRLLRGWSWHLGGLAVVVGLMLATGPWDWALAASLGVLLAGLVQLPWWRLAAVGAVLCLVAGVGWGVDRYRAAQEKAAQEAQRSQENMSQLGERSPDRVLPALLEGIGQGDVVGVCGLLAEPARNQFVQVAGTRGLCECGGAFPFGAAARSPVARPRRTRRNDARHGDDRRRLPHRRGRRRDLGGPAAGSPAGQHRRRRRGRPTSSARFGPCPAG